MFDGSAPFLHEALRVTSDGDAEELRAQADRALAELDAEMERRRDEAAAVGARDRQAAAAEARREADDIRESRGGMERALGYVMPLTDVVPCQLTGPERVAGCDFGKSAVKLVVGSLTGGALTVESAQAIVHDGQPFEVFRAWYQREHISTCVSLGATGAHATGLVPPVVAGLPEEACYEAALVLLPEGPLRLVNVGAHGYSVLVRDGRGHTTFHENEKCSSGTGETMVRLTGRLGLEIEEADRLAARATEAIPITARCSVFAKSELTHLSNQGRPLDALLRGYFESIARYVLALAARARDGGPIYIVGGVGRITTFVDALRRQADCEVIVPERALFFEAYGAALLAAEQPRAPLPEDPLELMRPRQTAFRALVPARRWSEHVRILPHVVALGSEGPVVLGLDLGSTGSKAVLTSLSTGQATIDYFDGTRGNPVEAAGRLLRRLLESPLDVRAIGVTGSGREAVATVMRAALPDAADRIVVLNEIVAHATAAIRSDDQAGRSLSVVEIGGQDAKFIQVVGGQIVESDMNKACSAGTGSFLEEQALLYGVKDVQAFGAQAELATAPPDLGQNCTVFVAEAAAEARREGYEIADLFAGFQYSVIHNYMNRVMGDRAFGERIFFQGKPASSRSLAWTLAAVSGRDVIVPDNPGAMGAWGIGLCTLEQLGRDALTAAPPIALARYLEANVVARTTFQCKDPQCLTLCNIDRTTVEIRGVQTMVLSGGACPKYEVAAAGRAKLPKEAPSAFDEREALVAPFCAEPAGGAEVAVVCAGASFGLIPFLATFVRELGLRVQVVRSDSHTLARGEERCSSYDSCAPVKVAHALADSGATRVFFPKIVDVRDRDGGTGVSCPLEQALPDMVESAVGAQGRELKVVRPVLSLKDGLAHPTVIAALVEAAAQLGAAPTLADAAVRRAEVAQHAYEAALATIGHRTLTWAREHQAPVIAIGGALHVIHDRAVNAGIPAIVRQTGTLCLPMDCYPIPVEDDQLAQVLWGDENRALRVAVAARARGDVYPLLLSSFGCGPASFAEHLFEALTEGYPHTALESDGHGGAAGYITRVQAFLHTVTHHDRRPSPAAPARIEMLRPEVGSPVRSQRDARLVVFAMSDRLGRILAAVYRSLGRDAVAAGPNSAATLAAGRHDCSGKECLPYQMIWGGFRSELTAHPPDGRRTSLLQVTSAGGACRNCMFAVKDRLSIDRMGLSAQVSVDHLGVEPGDGVPFNLRIWGAITTWDVLHQLAAYHRPVESKPGEVDGMYQTACDELEALLGQPVGSGARAVVAAGRGHRALAELTERWAKAFADLARRAPSRPEIRTVLLTGDIYLRLDDFASGELVRSLNARGLRVVIDPMVTLVEHMHAGSPDRLERLASGGEGMSRRALRRAMQALRRIIYARARRHHGWLPMPEVEAMVAQARPILAEVPRGEAPLTIGSVLESWQQRVCDGVVVVGAWGCGPAQISESMLRQHREIPMLFVYSDGSPLDERRLAGFAFRLRRDPPRAAA
jgi:activator of 2-hydroxyglutaryl-CoA dehydratase/predicted nucleotide-binding protein (sugar kinase/HSP70/actin superfamily)